MELLVQRRRVRGVRSHRRTTRPGLLDGQVHVARQYILLDIPSLGELHPCPCIRRAGYVFVSLSAGIEVAERNLYNRVLAVDA